MPREVPYNSIDDRVVENFDRLMKETAKERGHNNVDIQQPFHCRDASYSDVLSEIRQKTPEGLDYYRLMVRQMPWYVFSNEPGK